MKRSRLFIDVVLRIEWINSSKSWSFLKLDANAGHRYKNSDNMILYIL